MGRIARPEHTGANIWFDACNFKHYADLLKEEYRIELTWAVEDDRLYLHRECLDTRGNILDEHSDILSFPLENWSWTLHDQAETLYLEVMRNPGAYNPQFA